VQELLTEIIVHLSHSHQQMARIMDSKRQVAVRMAHMIQLLPDEHPELDGLKGLLSSSTQVSKSVIAYLNSLAELEEAMADSLTQLIKANDDSDEE
jgi:hypothetical protein